MIFFKKPIITIVTLLYINILLAQSVDILLKTNPLLELGINTKTLALKGNIKEMQEHLFVIDNQEHSTNDSVVVSNVYKFDPNGFTIEIEETINNLQTKNSFFSYTNKGYISHIDIETTPILQDKDSIAIKSDTPVFSTVDYKYVPKKNILYKGEDFTEKLPKKTTIRKEYFYHFNDENQIFQINDQNIDVTTLFNYNSNGLLKESLTSKSGITSHKNIYKYDRNNRVVSIITINPDNATKFPNKETTILYKLDPKGNVTEKKVKTYLYSPKGTKKFIEGFLFLYNYTYL